MPFDPVLIQCAAALILIAAGFTAWFDAANNGFRWASWTPYGLAIAAVMAAVIKGVGVVLFG